MEAPLKQTWTRVLGDGNDAPIILQLLQPGQDRMQQDNTEQSEDSQGTVCWEIMVFSSFIYSGRSTNDHIIQSWKAEQEEIEDDTFCSSVSLRMKIRCKKVEIASSS